MSIEEREFEAGLMEAPLSAPVYASQPDSCPVGAGQVHKVQIFVKDFQWAFTDERRGIVEKQLHATASRLLDEVNGRRGLPRRGTYDVSFSECHFDGAQGEVALAGTYENGVSDYYLPGTDLSMARIDSVLRLYFPEGAPEKVHLMLEKAQ